METIISEQKYTASDTKGKAIEGWYGKASCVNTVRPHRPYTHFLHRERILDAIRTVWTSKPIKTQCLHSKYTISGKF